MFLVTGASGTAGAAVVRTLSAQGHNVRALVRQRAHGTPLFDQGVELIVGDMSERTVLDRAVDGVQRLVLISPAHPQQITLQANVIEAALRAQVGRIVKLSIVGAAPDAPWAVGRWHWETERALSESGLSWCSVRPMPFMQNLYTDVPALLSTYMLYGCQGDGRTAMVDVRDVAATIAALLVRDDVVGESPVLTGPEALSFDDVASVLSYSMAQPVTYVNCAREHFIQSALAAGIAEWSARDQAAMQTHARRGHLATVTDAVKRLTGQSPRRFASFANEFAASVRYTGAPTPTAPYAGIGAGAVAAG